MAPVYTSIDPNDREAVVWLQRALGRLASGTVVHIGRMSTLTVKAIRLYQHARKLPITGEADAPTLQRIRQELEDKGLTP